MAVAGVSLRCHDCCSSAAPGFAWEHWGGDRGGTRFSPLDQITPANVGNLVRAWDFRTGDLESRPPAAMARTKFEATPLFVEDSLIFCTPFNEVIALDPGTRRAEMALRPEDQQRPAPGQPLHLPRRRLLGRRPGAPKARACRSRIFMGTNDVARDRARCQDRHALRGFRRERRGQDRDRQGAAMARRIPDHLGAGGEPRRGRGRLLDRRQCPRRCAARHRARLRCAQRALALELRSADP